jgi:hypothetical protein
MDGQMALRRARSAGRAERVAEQAGGAGAAPPCDFFLSIHKQTQFTSPRTSLSNKSTAPEPYCTSLLHRHFCAIICLRRHAPLYQIGFKKEMVLVMHSPCRTCACMSTSPLRVPLPLHIPHQRPVGEALGTGPRDGWDAWDCFGACRGCQGVHRGRQLCRLGPGSR